MSDLFTNVESDQILKTHGLPKPANLLRHLPQIHNAKYYCMVCDDQYYMYIFVHVVFFLKICNIEYNHDNNNNKKNILKQEHVLNS